MYVEASCDECDETQRVNVQTSTNPKAVFNKLKTHGWRIKGEGRKAKCPSCVALKHEGSAQRDQAAKDAERIARTQGGGRRVVMPALPRRHEVPLVTPVLSFKEAQGVAAEIDAHAVAKDAAAVDGTKTMKAKVTVKQVKEVAARVRGICDRIGRAPTTFGEGIGISKATMSRVMLSHTSMRPATLHKILDACDRFEAQGSDAVLPTRKRAKGTGTSPVTVERAREVAARVRGICDRAGKSPTRFGKDNDISQATMSRVMRGIADMRASTLRKVVEACDSFEAGEGNVAKVMREAVAQAEAPAVEAPKKPGVTMAQQRQIFMLLVRHFDEPSSAYEEGWSDERIAESAGVPFGVVTEIRREAYGPVDLVMAALALKVAEAEDKLAEAVDILAEIRSALS